jgi:alkaline phosphatase D
MSHESSARLAWSRRQFLSASAGTALSFPLGEATHAVAAESALPHQATGTKVGEVTDTSAIVWTRLTAQPTRNNAGVVIPQRKKKTEPRPTPPENVAEIEGACPGAAGRIRVRYQPTAGGDEPRTTEWADVDAKTDFTHHFTLTDLKPDTAYTYTVETQSAAGEAHAPREGKFHTAPTSAAPSDFRFCVMTCQGYPDRDHADGHHIYPSMLALEPRFVAMTGDVVYYDNDEPEAKNVELARLHWERMFSLPRQVELLQNVAGYWLKDDHDTLDNDSWPGERFGRLTFAEGQQIFREQTPMSGPGYRTFRWGRDLQIWLTDGRDHRSPNTMADGPEKTIWGAEQKAWFKKTVAESDATWKILISPTPLVGPDRMNKNDNHSNVGFAHEGNEIREWIKSNVPENFFVCCGDRHWQYHSVHPMTGVREFSVGAASDAHAGGTPGENPEYHKFHRVAGGFLSVTVKPDGKESELLFEHRDVFGKVVYEWKARRAV